MLTVSTTRPFCRDVWKYLSFGLHDLCLDEKEKISTYMKLACSTVFVCFNYSTSFSNDDFSSSKNSTIVGLSIASCAKGL